MQFILFMIPNFEIFGKTFSFYQLIALAGVLVTGYFAVRECRRRKLDDNDVIVYFLMIAIGVLVGSHLLYALTQAQYFSALFRAASVKEFFTTVYYLFGGSVFYGGLLGGIAAGAIYLRAKRFPFADFADLAAPAAALFHTFGRLGCFFSGCCYGVECDFGFVYRHAQIPQANAVSRFPVQLCEAAGELVLFLVLWRLYRKGELRGRLLLLYLVCYAVMRFGLEFLRGDEYRGFLFGLSTSQWISIFVCAAAVAWGLLRRRSSEQAARSQFR